MSGSRTEAAPALPFFSAAHRLGFSHLRRRGEKGGEVMSLHAGFSNINMALTGEKEPLALKRSAKVFFHRINQNPVTGTNSKEKEKATPFPPRR